MRQRRAITRMHMLLLPAPQIELCHLVGEHRHHIGLGLRHRTSPLLPQAAQRLGNQRHDLGLNLQKVLRIIGAGAACLHIGQQVAGLLSQTGMCSRAALKAMKRGLRQRNLSIDLLLGPTREGLSRTALRGRPRAGRIAWNCWERLEAGKARQPRKCRQPGPRGSGS